MIQWDSNDHIILDKKSGDRDRVQNAVDYESDLSQNHLDNLRTGMVVPTTQNMYNWAHQGAQNAFADYGDIMGRYRSYMDDPQNKLTADQVSPDSIGYTRSGEMGEALAGYGDFARTGGFTGQNLRDIRARGISPIRAAYGNTIRELDRARSLGGDSGATNYIAARSRAQRELPQQLSDATQNVNAGIAQMVQQGRLAGLGGLSSTAQADATFAQRAALANQAASMQAKLANQAANLRAGEFGINNRLGALSGMANMYSATPGQASTFGNQVLNSTQNWLNAQQLQQQKAKTKIEGQLGHSGLRTGFGAFLDNTGKAADIFTDFMSGF